MSENAKTLIQDPVERWLRSLRADPRAETDQSKWMTALTLIVMWYSLRIKHEAYERENEVRLMMQNGGSDPLTPLIEFRHRGSSVVPYVPKTIGADNPENIHEIVIGPAADDATLDALHTLAEKGPLRGVPLRKSDIPYKPL
jgi:hypothetical protein